MAKILTGYVINGTSTFALNSLVQNVDHTSERFAGDVVVSGGGVDEWTNVEIDFESVFVDRVPQVGEYVVINGQTKSWLVFRSIPHAVTYHAGLAAFYRSADGTAPHVLATVVSATVLGDTVHLTCTTTESIIVFSSRAPTAQALLYYQIPIPNGRKLVYPSTGYDRRVELCQEYHLQASQPLPPCKIVVPSQIHSIAPGFWLGFFAEEFCNGLTAAQVFAQHQIVGTCAEPHYIESVQTVLDHAKTTFKFNDRIRTYRNVV